jgi:hypothetical protein
MGVWSQGNSTLWKREPQSVRKAEEQAFFGLLGDWWTCGRILLFFDLLPMTLYTNCIRT